MAVDITVFFHIEFVLNSKRDEAQADNFRCWWPAVPSKGDRVCVPDSAADAAPPGPAQRVRRRVLEVHWGCFVESDGRTGTKGCGVVVILSDDFIRIKTEKTDDVE